MLRIDGEITTFLSDINYQNKEELMNKLREIRRTAKNKIKNGYSQFYPMIGVAIQQAYYTSEKQLMRYKKYCNSRVESSGGNYGKQTN